MKMVIAILSDLYHETRLLRMVETLQQDGWQITLVSAGSASGEHPFQGVEFIPLRLKPRRRLKRYYFAFMWQLFRLSRQLEADCFLAVDPPALFPLALRRRCRPLIYDSREFFTEMGTVVKRPLIRQFWYRLERFGIRRANGWMTVCAGIERELRQLYGVNPGQVIRNTARAQTPLTSNYLRRHFNLPPEQTILLYQGGLWSAYDFTPLNEAMLQLPQAVLIYLGDGPLLEGMQQWVAQEQAADRILFHPRVVPQQLPEITASADIGVILIPPAGKSYWYLLPNKLFEFIQARLPLLVSDFPELMDVVTEYAIGTGVDPTDSEAILIALRHLVTAAGQGDFDAGLDRAARELTWEQEETSFRNFVRQQCV
ncbi:MAG: glycosyltransferase [Candidatus Delongbacteria bacterium]|nr:glycosyltransferase [Candidatus Delongbacteria bacterium]